MEKKRIKIGFFVNYFVPGGMEKVVLLLINALDFSRFEPFLYIHYKSDPQFLNRLHPRVKVFHLNRQNGRALIKMIHLIRRVRHDKLHLLQVHNWGNFLEGALVKLCCPSLLLIHVQQGTEYEQTRRAGKFKNKIRRFLRKTFIHLFDAVVGCSVHVQHYLREQWGARRTVVIHNGVDTQQFCNQERPLVAEDPRQAFRVCTVGRMVAVKNLKCLFEAVDLLRQRVPQVQLYHIGGDVGDSARPRTALVQDLYAFRKQRKLEDHIIFLGIRNDIPMLLGRFDVFVLTSFSEGLSLSLLEAQACGLPAVVTRVGGNPEVVRHGVNGYLVPSDDPRAVAEYLFRLYRRPDIRRRMGQAARNRILKRFDIKRMVERYQQLYVHVWRKREKGD